MLKKVTVSILALSLLLASTAHAQDQPPVPAESSGSPTIHLEEVSADWASSSFILEGTTLAPAEAFLGDLGFNVNWDESSQIIRADKDRLSLIFEMEATHALVHEQSFPLLQAPRVVEGVPYVPLRFAAEMDGRNVRWYDLKQRITIGEEGSANPVLIALPIESDADMDETNARFHELSDQVYKETQYRIEWKLIPEDEYQTMLNIMIASGDLPHLTYVPKPSIFPKGLLQSIVYDLDGLLADYPALASLPESSWEQVTDEEDRVLGIPKPASPTDGTFPVLRQDWMHKLGLASPTTMDELYEVAKLFTQHDPDGNGIHDTYGLTSSGLNSLAWVEHVFNESTGRYIVSDQSIVDTATLEGTRDALEWLSRAYEEGILDPEFAVKGPEQAVRSFQEGSAGMMALSLADMLTSESKLLEHSEYADLTPLISLQRDSEGTPITADQPAADGLFFIDTRASKVELEQALTVSDALASLEFEAELEPELEDVLAQRDEVAAQLKANSVDNNELLPKLTPDQQAILFEFSREMTTMKIKVIMGAASIEQWDEFILELKEDPTYIEIMEAIQP